QSDLDSHNGSTAGLNGCTNGCISVEEISSFSYHVAAGRTISEYKGVEVIRKSKETSKSNFPSTSSLQTISSGFSSSFGEASNPSEAPSKCFIKYSCPFAELEIRLERHTNSDFGKFSGEPGSSTAALTSPVTTCSYAC